LCSFIDVDAFSLFPTAKVCTTLIDVAAEVGITVQADFVFLILGQVVATSSDALFTCETTVTGFAECTKEIRVRSPTTISGVKRVVKGTAEVHCWAVR
jgi:hypothetical protein